MEISMLVTLQELKRQLKLEDDFTEEDELLNLLGGVVQTRTETFLNRKLYAATEAVPEADPDGLKLPDDVKLGMLMLATHFYENRSSVSEVDQLEMPLSYKWLVGPYRFIPL
jgi:hypothetical protein